MRVFWRHCVVMVKELPFKFKSGNLKQDSKNDKMDYNTQKNYIGFWMEPKSSAGSCHGPGCCSCCLWSLLHHGLAQAISRNTCAVISHLSHTSILVWLQLSALYLGPESDHRGLNVVDYQRILMLLPCAHYSLCFYLKVLFILYWSLEKQMSSWLAIFQKALCSI